MIKSNNVVAMLLAGGQGSRLKLLTQEIAKPAVCFGGKYRIIDFTLSNATNSGISNIGILTQYKPFELNAHIGIGECWDFDRITGGLRILPPFMRGTEGDWYTGTANAIYQNIEYIDSLDAKYVLILSADHIYKMDYRKLFKYHIEKDADVTIATIEVPWREAYKFGILNVDSDNKVVEFDEKPKNPRNNMASMGIYIFNWDILKYYLKKDDKNRRSEHDFGKNVLPLMLNEGNKMYAWVFKGYWKDVGTIRSYWEANMDLLDKNSGLNLYDRDWRIYTRTKHLPPQYIGKNSVVRDSLINEGCTIEGEVNNSVVFSGATVEEGAIVNGSIIFSNAVIKKGAVLNKAIVLENTIVQPDKKICKEYEDDICLIEQGSVSIEQEEALYA
ncbi:MAG TPA: glucose-1-phosphate adenylyltransferase [Clostridia bacterium]|nr:glucose-1-phosphate adenylyltransferase [Clostridia bacterium]